MERDIQKIVSNFKIKGEYAGHKKVVTGHINDSYYIKTTATNHPGYFLQWINNHIFKDVDGLMNNITAVTQHLSGKLAQHPELKFDVLEIIPTIEKDKYYFEENGNFWRLYKYIGNSHGYDVVENIEIAHEGGKAFGIFMSLLADLPANSLKETIPDFHNLEKRLSTFYNVLNVNRVNRAKDIPDEIQFVKDRAGQMLAIPALIKSGKLPIRITHNDTKFNNILFDDSNHAMCIVDLDTVMPGSVLFDFGDSIRTGGNTAAEDEEDLSKVDINLPIYEAYTQGFLESTHNSLTKVEIENLAFSARFMTYIIGLRFITDFLDGDLYFRTNSPVHNLTRARAQFRLLEQMEKHADKMQSIVMESIEKQKVSQ
jgi:hypothetical protein